MRKAARSHEGHLNKENKGLVYKVVEVNAEGLIVESS